MRRFFTLRKTLALLAALLAFGVVWLATRAPREPVFEGKKLSWWFSEVSQNRATPLTREQLQSLGPGAVDWLAYQAGQTQLGERDDLKPPGIPARVIEWMRSRWYPESIPDFVMMREQALLALRTLGPDAAPAIPALWKILRGPNSGTRHLAAQALLTTGDAAWPAVTDAILHADNYVRWPLLISLEWRWHYAESPPFGPAEFAQVIDLLAPLTFDSDNEVCIWAQAKQEECVGWWSLQPDCAEGIRLLLGKLDRFRPEERWAAIEALANPGFVAQPSAIVPQLTALAATSDDQTRVRIMGVLGYIDPRNPEWVKQLDALAVSPDAAVAEVAQAAIADRRNRQNGVISPPAPANSAAPSTPP